jgi:DnaJ-like protein
MSYQGDPYRVLGLTPGASLNEIRSAYRRLAKQYHPDAAGDRALPRFLAIQAAYERLVDGDGQLRTTGGRGSRRASDASDPWRADPARARASREAWRARRAAGTSGASGATAGGSGPAGSTGGPAKERSPGGARQAGGTTGERHARRGPRKATPGSTTYDEARDGPRDPEWEGGSWYGPSSRTYWTINPREYADPRKHGPEYQARARRAAEQEAATGRGQVDGDGDAAAGDARWGWSGAESTTTDGGAEAWGAHGWSYEAPADGRAGDGGGPDAAARARAERAARPAPVGEPEPLPDLEAVARRAAPRNLLALALRPDRRWRLLLALIGWPPIGYAVGTLISTATHCATYSASCPEPASTLPLVAQPFVIAALFLVPPAAAAAAFASMVGLAVAVPVAAVLSVGTLPESHAGAPLLGAVVTVAYLVAFVAAAIVIWRPPRVGERVAGDDADEADERAPAGSAPGSHADAPDATVRPKTAPPPDDPGQSPDADAATTEPAPGPRTGA